MGRKKRTEEFRPDAVRIALTSGLTRKQVASDLGVGLSTRNKWVAANRDTDVVSKEYRDLARENERLWLTAQTEEAARTSALLGSLSQSTTELDGGYPAIRTHLLSQ